MNVIETVLFFMGILGYAMALVFVIRFLHERRMRDLSAVRCLAAAGAFFQAAFLVYHGITDQTFPVSNLFEAVVFVGVVLMFIGLAIDLLRSMPLVTVATIPMILPIFLTALAFMPQQTQTRPLNVLISEIGRASCRERV